MGKLGAYWSVWHRRPQDYDFLKRLQPTVLLVMDGGDVDYRWVRENLPNTTVLARDWALSEQHDDMLRAPVETGKRHAQEWNRHADRLGFDRAKTLVLGINEPRVWEAGVSEALRLYTIALCEEAAKLQLRVGAMQLGVGWPGNVGPDTPPNWNPWAGVEDAILNGNHALVLHEYWADSGPAENWGWWAGRSLKCPWNVPIVIGEAGLDMFVRSATFEGNRGWQGHFGPERYAADLVEYTKRMSVDSRFMGCAVFTCDFANGEWWSFDVEPAYNAILSTPIPVVEPTKPTPPVVVDPDSQFERALNFILLKEGGFQNNPADKGNYYNGQLIGTKYGISAASWGGEYDIPNLTIEQAATIYYKHYWLASGADKLSWPLSLLVFDTAVLHGVSTAVAWLQNVGPNPFMFAAKRLHIYTVLDNWPVFGAGWVNRVADLMAEIGRTN